jgi:hypothetical protein
MLSRLLLLFSVLGFVNNSYAGIDLSPAVTTIVEDGVTFHEVGFKTAEGKVAFTLPTGWTITGQKNRAQMSPSGDKSAAEAVVEAASLEKPAPLDEATMAAFKQQVIATLPAGSTKITTVIEAQNSIMLAGNPSFEVVVSYDLWGKVFQRSALLVNGAQERLAFRFTCSKADFSALNTVFRRSLMSWHAVSVKESANNVAANASTSAPKPAAD